MPKAVTQAQTGLSLMSGKEEYEGKVVIGKCDVDQNNDLAMKFSVRNIPLVVFVKPGGQMNDKLVGAASKDAIKAKIDALL